MVLRQVQEQRRRIWNIPDDKNSRFQAGMLMDGYFRVHDFLVPKWCTWRPKSLSKRCLKIEALNH